MYWDRTHRDIPGTFGEDLDIYDVELQHQTQLGARHAVVWGLGYRLINDHVANTAALAFLPAHVARQWVTGFVHDEIALVPDRLRARVAGAYMVVNYGVRPLGSLAGGAFGATIGLQPTLWIASVGAIAGLLWSLPSPVRTLRELPEQAA